MDCCSLLEALEPSSPDVPGQFGTLLGCPVLVTDLLDQWQFRVAALAAMAVGVQFPGD